MRNEEVRRALIELAKDDDTAPRAGFVAELEGRLRNQPPLVGDYANARPAAIDLRSPRPVRRLAPAFAALVLLFGGAAYAVSRDPGSGVTSFGAGSTIAPITLDMIPSSSSSSTTVAPSRPESTPPVAESRRQPATTTAPVIVERPAPTSAPTTEPVAVPTSTSTTRPRESTTSSTRSTTTTVPIASITLGAGRVGATDQVALEWTPVAAATRYIVVRTVSTTAEAPAEPVYPAAAPSEVAVEVPAPTRTAINVAAAPITSVRYRVVALDGSNRVVGKSQMVQVNLPR